MRRRLKVVAVTEHDQNGLPGFDRFICERIIPAAFRVPCSPDFNLKDGQVIVVSFHKDEKKFDAHSLTIFFLGVVVLTTDFT